MIERISRITQHQRNQHSLQERQKEISTDSISNLTSNLDETSNSSNSVIQKRP
jgi:hypothetical protein